MDVTARAAVIAQKAHVRSHRRVAGRHQTGLAVGAEILGGIEAERRGDAH